MESAWGTALSVSVRGHRCPVFLGRAHSFLLEMCARRSPVAINGSAQSCSQLACVAPACLHSHRVCLVFHACDHAELNAGAIEVVVVAADLEIHVPSKVVGEEPQADGVGHKACGEWH